jgi:hypothetical protein
VIRILFFAFFSLKEQFHSTLTEWDCLCRERKRFKLQAKEIYIKTTPFEALAHYPTQFTLLKTSSYLSASGSGPNILTSAIEIEYRGSLTMHQNQTKTVT